MRRLIALGVVVLVVVVFGVGQLVLPGIAASRLRSRLAQSGQVLSVQVSAFPAIKLLWHHADSVVIRMGRYQPVTPSALGSTLAQAGDVGRLTASAQELVDGLLTLHDATLSKRGDLLAGHATVDESDLRSALPILDSVTPVASSGGQLTLQGTASLFGVTGTIDVTVAARDGDLVAAPDLPLVPTITLFSHPGISVEGISARPVAGGFVVNGTAALG